MNLRRQTTLLVLLSAAFAVAVVAAIGSGSASAGAGERAKGAIAVPATALAYASVNLDRSGPQFGALESLAGKVPGGDAAVQQLNAMLDGTSQQAEVAAALGGDVSVGLVGVDLTGIASGGMPKADAIVVASAADAAALPGVLQRAGFAQGPAIGGMPVWEKGAMAIAIDGSTAIGATSRATLTEALAVRAGQQPALADDPAFTATLAKLPGDASAVAYIAPARFAGLLQTAGALLPKGGQGAGMPDATTALKQLGAQLADVRGLGIAVTAEQGGLRVIAAGDADQAALEQLGLRLPTAYTPEILAQVPADAVGFAVFRDLGPTLLAAVKAAAAQDPQVAGLVASVETTTGVTLEGLATALGGEHAVYAQAGSAPGAALLTQPADPKSANAVLSNALVAAQQLTQSLPKELQQSGAGARATLPKVALTQSGGTLAIGTLPDAASTPAASIVERAAYRDIVGRAGLPAAVSGLAYLDAAQVRAAAQAKGAEVPAGAKAVNGVLAWGTANGAELFVSIG